MSETYLTRPNFKTLWVVTVGAILVWTLMLGCLLVEAIEKEEEHVIDLAQKEARTNFNKDLALRNWASIRGGVYVEMDRGSPPNPYLAQLPERDIETPSGRRLTLVNPAYMLRQTMQEFSDLYGVKGRITSLQPLNPVNRPDPWETETLQKLQAGDQEVSEVTSIEGEPYLRYMKAFFIRETCLNCHASQGLELGAVSGGLSVSIPLQAYLEFKDDSIERLSLSYGSIWLLGLFSIGVGNRYSRRQIVKKWQADQALREKSQQLQQERQLFITGPTVVFKWRAEQGWPVEYVSPNVKDLLGYTKEELEAGDIVFTDLLHADDLSHIAEEVNEYSCKHINSFEQEYRLQHKDGRFRWFYDFTNIIRDDDGNITYYHGYILDTSDRKQALEKLAKSELKYRSVINNTHEGFWYVDRDFKTLEINDSLCVLLGYRRAEMMGKTPLDFVDEENRKIFETQSVKVPYTEHRIYDIALRHKNGTNVPTTFTTTTLRGRDGEVLGAFAFVTDQTKQKKVEHTLRETKDRLAFALDGAQEGLWDWKIQTGEVYFSPRIEIMLGYESGEWEPHIDTWRMLLHPDDLDRVVEVMNEHLAGRREYYQTEYRMLHKDGRWIWIMDAGRVVEWDTHGKPLRAVGTHMDISERKEMEQALARSQSSLAEAQRIAKIGNWELDLIHDELIWSDQIYRIFEVDKEEFKPSYQAFLKTIHPDDSEIVDHAFTESITNKMPYDITHRLLMEDGRIKYVHEICETQYDESGQPVSAHGTVQDVTEYHQAKLDLIAAKERAEAATKAKTDFLATMSHEIRTPMNGVIGMAELLSDTELDGAQRDSVEVIRKSGQMLLGIINDILDFSKLDASQVELESIPFNLEVICHNVLEMVAPKANEKELELILDFAPDCPRQFNGDPGRLRQVLLNLVCNALKFTDTGYVRLKVEHESVTAERVKLAISVKDTGIGIESAKQANLFEAFTQADQATTRKYGGTGLGLSISKKLIHLMEGEISVESAPDLGSTFRISLELTKIASALPFLPLEMKGVRLLLLDQSRETGRAMRPLFDYLGIHSMILNDKAQVLPELHSAIERGEPFQIAFLDQPKYASDGIVLGQAIRSLPELSTLRLVALTGLGNRGDAAYFKKSGFDAYLNKPVISTTLIKVIGSLLEQQYSDQEILTRYSVEEEGESRIDAHQFKGRILLVEDVVANQKVASTMLRKLGLRVDIADNGLRALMLWKAGKYDLIFMDCRMPEMDGYQATRIIRQQENGENVPIIALTANVTPNDRQRCMQAGMSDIITKPFIKAELANCLKRWSGHSIVQEQGMETENRKPASNVQMVIDFGVVEKLKQDMGEEFRLVLDAIQQSIVEILERLEHEFQLLPTDELTRLAHSLKSTCANIGAIHLHEMARDFEQAAEQGKLDNVMERLVAMKLEYQQILKIFREKGI